MQTLNLTAPPSRPYGQRVGNLTRFGETWIDLGEIQMLEFGPADGCGCEIVFKGQPDLSHVRTEDAGCVRRYFTDMTASAKLVDSSAAETVYAKARAEAFADVADAAR